MLRIIAAYAVARCLSVRPFVTFVYCMKMSKDSFTIFYTVE